MKKIILILLVFLYIPLFAPTTLAVDYHKECVDNNTIRTTIVREVCDEEGCYNITIDEENICEYGCLEGEEEGTAECKNAPWVTHLIVVSIIFVLAIVGYYLMR